MSKWDILRDRNEQDTERALSAVNSLKEEKNHMVTAAEAMALKAEFSDALLEEIDSSFEKATHLDKVDVSFLLFATALQCVRQYVIGTLTQRVDDQTAAARVKGKESHRNNSAEDRIHKLYNPTLEEIITKPVPFDAIFGSRKYNLGIGGGFTHRAKTIGHDPLLGWIFGTMNIATSTVTVSDTFQSYHVLTGTKADGVKLDKISKHADTGKVIWYSKNQLLHEGLEGKEKIGAALLQEAIHLKSDMYSIVSLPVPIVSSVSVDAARRLSDYGVDMGNILKVGNQTGYAILINSLIGMVHGLYYDKTKYSSWDLYSVKTRKILMYSNMIASASNVIAVAVAAAIGANTGNPELIKKAINYADIGGIVVTIYRIVNDTRFRYEVKREFLKNNWYDMVMDN